MTVLSDSSRLTVTAIAAHFGCSRQSVYTWRKEGMPVSDDLAVLESWVAEHKPPEGEEEGLSTQLLKARIAKTQEEAAAKSLDNRVREGELVNKDAVNRWLSSFATEIRQTLESFTPTVVAEIPGEHRLIVNDILAEQVRLLLLKLAAVREEMWADESVREAE